MEPVTAKATLSALWKEQGKELEELEKEWTREERVRTIRKRQLEGTRENYKKLRWDMVRQVAAEYDREFLADALSLHPPPSSSQ